MYGWDFLCGISNVTLKFRHKISYPYIENVHFIHRSKLRALKFKISWPFLTPVPSLYYLWSIDATWPLSIALCNNLGPILRQDISWINSDVLSIGLLRTNIDDIGLSIRFPLGRNEPT